jgi:hypothetical protein
MDQKWIEKADPNWIRDVYRRVVGKREEVIHPNEQERGQAAVDAAHEAYLKGYDSATAAEHVLDNAGLVSLSAQEKAWPKPVVLATPSTPCRKSSATTIGARDFSGDKGTDPNNGSS